MKRNLRNCGAYCGLGYLALALIAGFLIPCVASAQNPKAALAPIIFEKPNSSRFEVVWFHPDFHSRVVGNLEQTSQFASPFEVNREGIVSSRVSLAAPFAVYRVAAYLDTVDISSALPGDENTPLDLQLTVDRESLTLHPTDIEFSAASGGGPEGLVTVFPALSFANGDSLYAGLQWRAGTPSAPMLGGSSKLGSLASQEYVFRQGAVNHWSVASQFSGIEIEALGWRPDTLLGEGSASFARSVARPHFVVWYAPDSISSIDVATSSAIVTSDTLSWETALGNGGFVTIVAEDDAGKLSDTLRARVPTGSFKKITLSAPEIVFDRRNPETLTQSILVTNEGHGPVNIVLRTDDSRVEFSDTTLVIGGFGRFEVVTIEMTEPPRGAFPELHSLYIFNDSGWLPLKVDLRAIGDIRTSVDDDSPKPLSFELSEVYPNPNFGFAQLRIVSPRSKTYKIDIYNVLGQLLQSEERAILGETTIPITLTPSAELPLAAGVYFVRVSSGSESTMRKMVFVK